MEILFLLQLAVAAELVRMVAIVLSLLLQQVEVGAATEMKTDNLVVVVVVGEVQMMELGMVEMEYSVKDILVVEATEGAGTVSGAEEAEQVATGKIPQEIKVVQEE